MPIVLLMIAAAMILIGVRGQANNAMTLLQSEFVGANSFIQWFLAIMILGLVGYIKPVRPFADGMIGLVLVAMFLNKSGAGGNTLFHNLETAFQNTTPLPSQKVTTGNGASSQSGAAGAASAATWLEPGFGSLAKAAGQLSGWFTPAQPYFSGANPSPVY